MSYSIVKKQILRGSRGAMEFISFFDEDSLIITLLMMRSFPIMHEDSLNITLLMMRSFPIIQNRVTCVCVALSLRLAFG
jgi:hypothetical protein